jgi:HK97 family phage portal protein
MLAASKNWLRAKGLIGATGYGDAPGWFSIGPLDIGWQRNLVVGKHGAESFGPVYTCTAIISQEMARLPIQHYRTMPDQRRVLVTNKAVSRVFRKPNQYQTKSDFMLWMLRSMLLDGNAYAVAKRNDRYEVESLHPVNSKSMWPYIVDGEVYYRFGDQTVQELAQLEEDQWYPQRDVLHIRMHCPNHPLVGETPITAAMFPIAAGREINKNVAEFFHNMSRPSGILRHPGSLDEVGITRIKKRFLELTKNNNTGEPLVLQEGMDWKSLTMSAVDAELIASYKLTERQVAQVFRIPPFLLGDLEKATFQNVESLSRFFVQSSLGFYVDHIEDSFGSFFNLPPDEYIHFDVEAALLRGDLKERMEAYAKGVQNGVITPNEARAREALPPKEFGDEPRVQQQLVPLSYGEGLQPPGMPEPVPDDSPKMLDETEEQFLAASIIAQRAIKQAMSQDLSA